MSIPPPGPLAYEGAIAIPFIIRNFAPTTANNTFSVPTLWIDPLHGFAWLLLGKPMGVADWALMASSSGDILQIDTPDGGHVVGTAGVVTFANGAGMNITGAGSTVTFNSTGGGLTWNSVAGTSQALAAGNAYVPSNGALTTFSLPAVAAFGDFFIISGLGAGGWAISQGAGQSIILGNQTSTIGAGGSVASTLRSDSIQLVCVAANTTFKAMDFTGNLTVV